MYECSAGNTQRYTLGQSNMTLNISPFTDDFPINIFFSNCHAWLLERVQIKKYIQYMWSLLYLYLVVLDYGIYIYGVFKYMYFIYAHITYITPNMGCKPNWLELPSDPRPKACTASGLKPARQLAVGVLLSQERNIWRYDSWCLLM